MKGSSNGYRMVTHGQVQVPTKAEKTQIDFNWTLDKVALLKNIFIMDPTHKITDLTIYI